LGFKVPKFYLNLRKKSSEKEKRRDTTGHPPKGTCGQRGETKVWVKKGAREISERSLPRNQVITPKEKRAKGQRLKRGTT